MKSFAGEFWIGLACIISPRETYGDIGFLVFMKRYKMVDWHLYWSATPACDLWKKDGGSRGRRKTFGIVEITFVKFQFRGSLMKQFMRMNVMNCVEVSKRVFCGMEVVSEKHHCKNRWDPEAGHYKMRDCLSAIKMSHSFEHASIQIEKICNFVRQCEFGVMCCNIQSPEWASLWERKGGPEMGMSSNLDFL